MSATRAAATAGASLSVGDPLRAEPATAQARRSFVRRRATVIALAAIVFAWAFAPFVLVALDAAARHRVFLGVAGYYPMDGLQYLAWVRDGHDGLIRNLYGSVAGKAVFVHPMFSLTGLVQGTIGLSSPVIMGFWKAVSAAVLLAGCLRAARRYIPRPRRGIAVVLALFGGFTPLVALLPTLDHWQAGPDFARAAGDLVPAMSLWDYAPLAIAMGLMPFAIERAERVLDARGGRRTVCAAAALGLLIAWLHPWQGITLIAVVGGLGLFRWLDARREPGGGSVPRRTILSLGAVLAATAIPVLYYLMLSRIDSGWLTSEQNSVTAAFIPAPVALTCEAPVALVALLAALRCRREPAVRALLLWPLATMLTIAVSPSGQYRALDGLAIPVALLVVRAWPRRGSVRGHAIVTLAALLATLAPFAYFAVGAFGHLRSPEVRAYTEPAPSDVRAVQDAARAPGAGPVLAPAALGTAVPAFTDALSWVGHPIWTPDYGWRKEQGDSLFAGGLAPAQARALIAEVRPRALIAPCGTRGHLRSLLASLGFEQRTIGCTRLYTR